MVRAKKLMDIGLEQAKGQDLSGAESTLTEAAQACREVSEPEVRADLLAKLAERYFQIDRPRDARRVLDEARKTIDGLEKAEPKAKNLVSLGRAQALMKDQEGAGQTLRAAEEAAAKIEDLMGRIEVFCSIAAVHHKNTQAAEADRVLQSALKAIEQANDARVRSDALAQLALTQAQIGKKAEAEKTFAQALETTAKIDDFYRRINGMVEIALKLSRAGLAEKAQELLNDAEKLTPKIPQPDLQQETLTRIREMMGQIKSGKKK